MSLVHLREGFKSLKGKPAGRAAELLGLTGAIETVASPVTFNENRTESNRAVAGSSPAVGSAPSRMDQGRA